MVRKLTFSSLLALVGLSLSVTAAPTGTVRDRSVSTDKRSFLRRHQEAKFKRDKANFYKLGAVIGSTNGDGLPAIREAMDDISKRERAKEDNPAQGPNQSSRGGLTALTEPALNGFVNPIATGIGRGVAGAAAETQQTTDLFGAAIDALLHALGGVATNAEQGAGVAVANAGSAVQSTVSLVKK